MKLKTLIKKSTLLMSILLAYNTISAQHATKFGEIKIDRPETAIPNLGHNSTMGADLETYMIRKDRTLQIVSPEAIKYIDISSNNADGDLPSENIARIKAADSTKPGDRVVLTITTDHFMVTYNLLIIGDENTTLDAKEAYVSYEIYIDPQKAFNFNSYDIIGQQQFKSIAFSCLSKKREIFNISTKKYGMQFYVNNIYTAGDYIILDITGQNDTKIQYNVSDIVFRLEDKKLTKATVSQEIRLVPIYTLYKDGGTVIKGKWRNIYLFKKFTYPEEKNLIVSLSEKEISGRKIELSVDYNQLLHSQFIN